MPQLSTHTHTFTHTLILSCLKCCLCPNWWSYLSWHFLLPGERRQRVKMKLSAFKNKSSEADMISLGEVQGRSSCVFFNVIQTRRGPNNILPVTFSCAPRRTRWEGLSEQLIVYQIKITFIFNCFPKNCIYFWSLYAHTGILIRLKISELPSLKLKTILWYLQPLECCIVLPKL